MADLGSSTMRGNLDMKGFDIKSIGNINAVTATELGYLSGVTSSIQTQLNGKVPTTTTVNGHALSSNVSVTLTDLSVTATAAELNALDGITATVTELNYVDGVTSNIQTQLNAKMATASVICGSSTFNSTTGVTITHNIGNTTYRVLITPTSNPSGYLGEIYVTKNTNTVVVYISGSTTTATFDYMIIKY